MDQLGKPHLIVKSTPKVTRLLSFYDSSSATYENSLYDL